MGGLAKGRARQPGKGRAARARRSAGTGPEGRARQGRAGARAGASAADSPRGDLYESVTRRIIAELEAGRFPWVQPWGRVESGTPAPGLPRNARTGRPYSGINILILWGAAIAQGFPGQGWLTFRQALEAGGHVRKGERGTTIVYAGRFVPGDADQAALRGSAAPPDGDEGAEARAIPFLRRFTVFNVAQCEGLRPGLAPEPVALPDREVVPLAEAVIAASGVAFHIGGNRAFYSPSRDAVHVPPQPAFFAPINYYRTCLHELTHATGHPSRLARDLSGAFGSKAYAREELIAELGAAFLCASLGIVPTVRHADYLAGWLDLLRDDLSDDAQVRGGSPRGRAIFRAASQASKAADWLLARVPAAQAGAAQAPSAAGPAA